MKKEHAVQLVLESLQKLKGMDMIDKNEEFSSGTVLLGKESPMDSIGFVTFVTELEERISKETKKDLYLVLDEINEFNINNPKLSVDNLAQYIVKLSGKE